MADVGGGSPDDDLAGGALLFLVGEQLLVWRGRELPLSRQQTAILDLLAVRHGHYVHREVIANVLWPAAWPDWWSSQIGVLVYGVASALAGTSAWVDRRRTVGYRLMGEIRVVRVEKAQQA